MEIEEVFVYLLVICVSLVILILLCYILGECIKFLLNIFPKKEIVNEYKNQPRVKLLREIEKLRQLYNNSDIELQKMRDKYEKNCKELDYFKSIVINNKKNK